jgi:hypothetical protein
LLSPIVHLRQCITQLREYSLPENTVTVTEDGFEYAGASYPSLTKVAKKITGVHWSGPRFFGLVRSGAQRAAKPLLNY